MRASVQEADLTSTGQVDHDCADAAVEEEQWQRNTQVEGDAGVAAASLAPSICNKAAPASVVRTERSLAVLTD